jgi:short coiled-coil protein
MAEHSISRPHHPRAFSSTGHDLGSPSPSMSNSSSGDSDDGQLAPRGRSMDRLRRPGLPRRIASGTLIVPRDAANIEVEENYGPGDARTMSPRRTSEEVDRLGESARQALLQ